MDKVLISCVLKGDMKTLRDMLDRNICNITKEDMLIASLHAASIKAKDIINVFLSKGLYINNVLVEAVKRSFENAISTLYEMGGDINYECNGYTLVTIAAICHNIECIETLLHYGAQLNFKTVNGETCLTCIAQRPCDYTKEIQYLVRKGANVNLSNDKGETALHFAAKYGNVSTLQSLLSFGAQVNHQNDSGETALIMASAEHHEQCVHLLLQNGAKKNLQSLKGDTALMKHIKCIYREQPSYKIVDLLLDYGCNINISDSEGLTPLFLAVQQDQRPIITKLLQFEANIFTETNHGMTPFLASILNGYDKLAAQFIDMECYISRNNNWKQSAPLVGFMCVALNTCTNTENCEALNQLFFGAGETISIRHLHRPHAVAIMAMETKHQTLKTITRCTIRSHLLTLSPINLITQVTKLPLPTSLK